MHFITTGQSAQQLTYICLRLYLNTDFFFSLSLTVHDMEFRPKESLRAVQKDSQLLFPHYFPCTGNEAPHVQTHKRARFLLAPTHRLQLDGDESSVTSDPPPPPKNTSACVCVRAPSDSFTRGEAGLLVCLKRYTHTLNNINVFTLSPRCEAFTAHQSDFAKDGFGLWKIFGSLWFIWGCAVEPK